MKMRENKQKIELRGYESTKKWPNAIKIIFKPFHNNYN